MTTIKRGTVLFGAVFLLSALQSFAIEGLKTTRQAANVVLSWPSSPSETYIVQYRPGLNPGLPWQTLVASLTASAATNQTSYVHTNGASGNNTGFYRVVRNDVHLFGITNGATISGTVSNVPFDQTQWEWRSMMLGYFFADWMNRNPLWVCVSNAVNGTYQTFQKMPSSVVIYGATDLQINSP
jgi:hypothetical protein